MTDLRTAAQQALEALEEQKPTALLDWSLYVDCAAAIRARSKK